jgi:ArsR family transcriptional regulator, arsenate/arsenite/antimonite-responsive transcriptional repressor
VNIQFKALQDETRRRILEMLRERDLTASEIAGAFSMSAPSISYHLDLLRQARLVSSKKEGQFVTYSLETTVLYEALGWLLNLTNKQQQQFHANKPKAVKVKLA